MSHERGDHFGAAAERHVHHLDSGRAGDRLGGEMQLGADARGSVGDFSGIVPGVRERLKATFVQIEFAGPQEFARRLDAERAQYGDIIRAAKIRQD